MTERTINCQIENTTMLNVHNGILLINKQTNNKQTDTKLLKDSALKLESVSPRGQAQQGQ